MPDHKPSMTHLACPNCGRRILLLPDTPRARAAATLAELPDQNPPPVAASRPPGRPKASPPTTTPPTPIAAPAAPQTQVIDPAAMRRAVYKRHGTDTIAAAAEWEALCRNNPSLKTATAVP